jgi:adenylosuccinate lyase
MSSPYDTYSSPLATRNASPEMLRIWSPRHKFNTWRRIWLAVAQAQHELGLPVSKEQVEELAAVVSRGITDEEMRAAENYERELRHDVMAHVHALGDSCPKAKGIIHLGMTSEDVGSNADYFIIHEAKSLVLTKIAANVSALGVLAQRWVATPMLGFTHYQPAQPLTVGRRVAQWAHDLSLVNDSRLFSCCDKPRGFRGATGTQASFQALFDGNSKLVDRFDAVALERLKQEIIQIPRGGHRESAEEYATRVRTRNIRLARERIMALEAEGRAAEAKSSGQWLSEYESRPLNQLLEENAVGYLKYQSVSLAGQTYPRVIDTFVIADLASVASVLHKIATDIRLLSNRKELDEPFEDKQVGSSAMPYKRNPMRCERICGLSRFVMNLVGNAYDTAATQWLERTLDDSSNRRLSLPEAFLALDGALDLMHNVASGLIVHEAMVRKNLMAELPFMATENILMACVKAGGDRQEYHEKIRVHAQAAGWRVKEEGADNDLLNRLQSDKSFWSKARGGPLTQELDWNGSGGLMDPMKYIGRSVEQTERFLKDVVEPLREQYKDAIDKLGASGPRV